MSEFDIEFYMEENMFCAYIGNDSSSGYKIKAETKKELFSKVNEYFIENAIFSI